MSAAWDGAEPAMSVVVSTYRREHYLADLLKCIEGQDPPPGGFEVVVVDNGSGDGTWAALGHAVERTALPMAAVRLDENHGPGGGRNAGVAVARAPIVAFTDDDCLPTAEWLFGVALAFADPVAHVVQGPVVPDPTATARGPWDHTIDIGGPTPWFETSNVAYRRDAFLAVGGFDEHDELTSRKGGGRAFGEDAILGWRVLEAGGARAWAGPDAVVHHRVVPGTLADRYRAWSMVDGFPGLAVRSGVVRDSMYKRVFLNRSTARFDLAAASVVAAVVLRKPWLAAGAYPWARHTWPSVQAGAPSRPAAALRVAQQFTVEGYGLLRFVRGSVAHRFLVL